MKRRRDEKMDNTHEMIDFLKSHTCYDLLPQSSRVVVFDSTLPIVKAFYALLQNGNNSFFFFLFLFIPLYFL